MSQATTSYTLKVALNHNTITLRLNIMKKSRKIETFLFLLIIRD